MKPRTQRIPLQDLTVLSPEHHEMMMKNQIDGTVPNIFKVLAHHPKLTQSWLRFAGYILARNTLPVRDREIAILRIGWLNQAPYEWEQHVRVCRRAGLTDADIERIKEGAQAGWSRYDAAVLQATDELYENSVIADETWSTLAEHYSREQMMDLVFTIGQYNLVSWALNSFGVPLDDFLPGGSKTT